MILFEIFGLKFMIKKADSLLDVGSLFIYFGEDSTPKILEFFFWGM